MRTSEKAAYLINFNKEHPYTIFAERDQNATEVARDYLKLKAKILEAEEAKRNGGGSDELRELFAMVK